ncbi:NADase-type glycan-binding domain-containing protein, partial [Streptomyces beijiangensis]|nr:hypothetical protein [Streptomyces beijiangensis]
PQPEYPDHTVTLQRPPRIPAAPRPPEELPADPRATDPRAADPSTTAQHSSAQHPTAQRSSTPYSAAPHQANSDARDTVPQPPLTGPYPPQSTAHSLLVPVPDANPYSTPPGGVLPGRPDAARPQIRTAQAAPQPENGAPCPACGTLNTAHRHFCRSCATPLAPQDAATAEGPYAGQRPRLNQGRGRWIARALVAVAVVAVVVGGVIGGPPAARAVQDHFAKRVAVHPTSFKASHSSAGHDAKVAFDGYSNTWWGTGYAGDSAGQYLEATFGQPTDLLNMVITPGTSKRAGQSVEQARPQEFDMVVTDSGGKPRTFHERIDDGGAQRIDLRVRGAVSVRLVLRSAYGAAPAKQVAIAELEYFGRSTS